MIRRDSGPDYLLFTQHDHALLAGELARQFGNGQFAPPVRGPSTLSGVAQHDAGWPLHDDAPTINKHGQPLDVFEVSREIALPVWTASADRAQTVDAYAGLLVSLHVLSLSVYATSQAPATHDAFATSALRDRFEINKFQHREIERQETLRKQLGLRLDLPLKHGLADPGVDRREDELTYDFRLLQAMDQISLALCCTIPPMQQTTELPTGPGAKPPTHLQVRRDAEWRVCVTPWPFSSSEIKLDTRARRVPAKHYTSHDDLRAAYANAPIAPISVTITAA